MIIHDRGLLLAEIEKQRHNPDGICSTCALGPSSPYGGTPLPHRECQRHLAQLAAIEVCQQCHFPIGGAVSLSATGAAICHRCKEGSPKAKPGINWDLNK